MVPYIIYDGTKEKATTKALHGNKEKIAEKNKALYSHYGSGHSVLLIKKYSRIYSKTVEQTIKCSNRTVIK